MKYESSFKSEADGLEISVMALIPDKKPYRAVVQLVHGMSEHKERYIPFMQYLAKLGYVVVIHDHRGHGKSVKHQDDLGFTYGGGAQAMLQDIRTVNRKIHAYYPELPLILMGHSMGSLAVRAFVAEHDSCVDMLIVCGSPSYNTAMPLGVAIAKTEKAVFGPRHRSLHLLLPHQHRRQILSGKHHRKAGRRKRILIHYNRLQQLPGIAHTAKG